VKHGPSGVPPDFRRRSVLAFDRGLLPAFADRAQASTLPLLPVFPKENEASPGGVDGTGLAVPPAGRAVPQRLANQILLSGRSTGIGSGLGLLAPIVRAESCSTSRTRLALERLGWVSTVETACARRGPVRGVFLPSAGLRIAPEGAVGQADVPEEPSTLDKYSHVKERSEKRSSR